MIEYQGWVVLRESFNEQDESEELLAKIYENLKNKVAQINDDRKAETCYLNIINGEIKLMVTGLDNHKSSSWEEMLSLYDWIAKNACGSYGLLHFFDDEDINGLNNHYQVLVLKKGKISFEIDRFLSPYIPQVEEL